MDYLPIFIKLQQQICWVIGGGTIAARKASLLLEAGATVTVIAPGTKNEMARLIEQGRCHWLEHAFADADLESLPKPKLIIAATDDRQTNQAVYQWGESQGILVNVADQTDLCRFILPAIIDRAPLTIALSTGGRSPVLARILKAKLEAMIPAGFGRLTELLGQFRDQVKSKLTTVEKRKDFWESTLTPSLIEQSAQGDMQAAAQYIQQQLSNATNTDQTETHRGEVYLIGAGPGDPELLTLKAHRFLQQADVVVYDKLVAPEIINLARREAERLFVGKSRGNHTLPQDQINHKLIELARQGLKVARLKGGDPYVFGRGGEEMAALQQQGIRATVIPGITAAVGCAASSGIPLTHRDYAKSVSFITGHKKAGAFEEVDYGRLADAGDTMVFYMGLHNAPKISAGLLAKGMAADTPVALIENGTCPQQKVWISDLQNFPNTIMEQSVQSPALILIGEVIKARVSA
ncbi:MAG: uroporphyrinogen-III C-methyltransferase [Piscirickettsiaceae bacterium CG_4_9_14_3_um_filter_43_564]|nr:uroporphyrinogen-III C-methyltransferase [Thiomicrospira sp.]OIP96545.1 MAG: uroporphyrinogen-III C-methyltransferase [Thiomicrospira sp. CG2_30_44_34]PIQ02898.1 MAG: uroporphyrinogen-III C-methyltransferase [Piscirickettsiaceae bacterium CG18_big_fil_WC_8_21_14_2_50_44_103]PIU38928.1 MAG: uroporphyrinogen-III C-methyltransferase [Piscirickettsiaceae bacterium CG07_land_8_20_14_0_80_44_28]PIW57450.1 MAG: uroporphyrinogen-III C-methyltransferase [Piscirickettsiaceae bacterium CG12_big_fil_rev